MQRSGDRRFEETLKSLNALLVARRTLAEKERLLIQGLRRVLLALGYELVPTSRSTATVDAPGRGGQATGSYKCPHCSRRFAQAMHLGRHVAASHGRKKRKK